MPSVWSLLPVHLPSIVTSGHLQESSGVLVHGVHRLLVLAAKARALLNGRPNASVEDIQSLAVPALRHRILPAFSPSRKELEWMLSSLTCSKKFPSDSLTSSFQLFYTLVVSPEKKDLLDPHYLSRIKDLSLLAKVVVDGSIYGVHRSVRQGGEQNFFQYRPYERGEDLKSIDWKVFAKRTN